MTIPEPAWGAAGRGFVVLAGYDYALDAPVLDRWLVPNSVSIDKGTLAYPPPPWKKEAPRPDRPMLEQFLALPEDNKLPTRVLAYARRWGPLGICRHGAIAGHQVLNEAERGLCTPTGYPNRLSEPLERWCYWARYMRSLLNLATAVEGGETGDAEDWKNVAGIPPVVFKRLFNGDSVIGRQAVAAAASSLLDAAPLTLRLVVEEGRYAMKLGSKVHFSALFCALAVEVVHRTLGRKLGVCSNCGRLFSARHARTGRRRWCRQPACQRAARAEASRQYRQRQKERIA